MILSIPGTRFGSVLEHNPTVLFPTTMTKVRLENLRHLSGSHCLELILDLLITGTMRHSSFQSGGPKDPILDQIDSAQVHKRLFGTLPDIFQWYLVISMAFGFLGPSFECVDVDLNHRRRVTPLAWGSEIVLTFLLLTFQVSGYQLLTNHYNR